MYFDTRPCAVCGAEVELRARQSPPEEESSSGPVGETDGFVGDGDSTVDERVCTNPDCPTRQEGRQGDLVP